MELFLELVFTILSFFKPIYLLFVLFFKPKKDLPEVLDMDYLEGKR
jgi:hypothetical protein